MKSETRAGLVAVGPEDFTPAALRGHAEILDALSGGLAAQAMRERDPEDRDVTRGLADDCRRFAAVFRGIADREPAPPGRSLLEPELTVLVGVERRLRLEYYGSMADEVRAVIAGLSARFSTPESPR
jgi:hypothetical protein